jgi:hypothetical protein
MSDPNEVGDPIARARRMNEFFGPLVPPLEGKLSPGEILGDVPEGVEIGK